MTNRRLVIAGTGSGVGKTTVALAIMAALQKKGFVVQGYKCGPDYIDPSYHTAVTKRVSRNLDSWMLDEEMILHIVDRTSNDADIAIIEGVMGLFDGKDPTSNVGSTAHISAITRSPVLLVVDCAKMARSVAAIVKGFQTFARDVHIVAVFANRVGSERHFQLVQTAIETECRLPVIGYFKAVDGVAFPESSFDPDIELTPVFEKFSETIDVDKLVRLAVAEPLSIRKKESLFQRRADKKVTIAVAKDAAFHGYYEENVELLESYGAEIVYFSPLNDEEVPQQADGLYLGGRLSEPFVKRLSEQTIAKTSIREAIRRGVPTYAEGGGFIYLTETYERQDGKTYDMVGVIPGKIIETKQLTIGYREVSGKPGNFFIPESEIVKGHEFHRVQFDPYGEQQYAYEANGKQAGFMQEAIVAGFVQLHFASNPTIARRFVERCYQRRRNR